MKRKKIISLITALTLLASALPAAAAEGGVTRGYVIDQFVEAVGKDSFTLPAADLSAFADSGEITAEYRESMGLAVANGLIKGYDDDTLRPEASITRLEALIILGRCLPQLDETRPATEFTDVPEWAEDEIGRLYRGGIVNGYGGGLLGSSDSISAEQVALLTSRVSGEEKPQGDVSLKNDFYSAVNKDFLSQTKPAEGELSASPIDDMADAVDERLQEISNELIEQFDNGTLPEASMEYQAAQFYKLALNAFDNETDISPLNQLIWQIEMCPKLSDLGTLCGDYIRDYHIPIMFDFTVPYKITRTEQEVTLSSYVYVDCIGAGMDKDYWEEGGEEARSSYVAYLRKILSLVNYDEALAEPIADLQISIEKAGKSYTEQVRAGLDEELLEEAEEAEPDERYMTGEDLSDRYGYAKNPARKAFDAIYKNEPNRDDKGAYSPREGKFFIPDLNRFDKAIELMNSADIKTLQAMCVVNLIESVMGFMPKDFRVASADYTASILGGKAAPETADSFATELTASLYSEYYEMKYLEKYSDFNTDKINSMVDDALSFFEERFRRSPSMSPATAVKAAYKLQKMGRSVAEASDDYAEADKFFIVSPKKQSLLETGLEIYGRYGGSHYSMYSCVSSTPPCYTVNASYSRYDNSFNIYAGFLNSPIYSDEMSEEELLGSLGFTIAHEISHAFDQSGCFFDAVGDYSRWWQDDDYKTYSKRADILAEVYSSHKTALGNSIDGKLTSDENIADIIAMDCVITLAKQKGLDLDKVFRAYAKSWAEVRTPRYDEYCCSYDVHSDGKTRVNAVLSNFDEFYEIYGVSEGDEMYVAPEKRVKFI